MTSQDQDSSDALPDVLGAALRRLSGALDHLEAATVRRAAVERARADLDEELKVMQDDRARLAADLDGALARNRTLTLAQADVTARLERAEQMVREIVADAAVDDGEAR
jgi:predicted  nucleic acid-binding Zn-ribbon protein